MRRTSRRPGHARRSLRRGPGPAARPAPAARPGAPRRPGGPARSRERRQRAAPRVRDGRRAREESLGHRAHDPHRRPGDPVPRYRRDDPPPQRQGGADRQSLLHGIHAHRRLRQEPAPPGLHLQRRTRVRLDVGPHGRLRATPHRHLGRRADAAAPYQLVDNANSLIDVTDMVFIDPIGTGFSKPVGAGTGKDFWGVDEDAASLTQFVRLYVTRNGRWNSPKFLIGESYGTTRSAVLVNRLQSREGMDFNGVVLISSVLDFETLAFAPGHDVSYELYLPSYAATAAYHHAHPAAPRPAGLRSTRYATSRWGVRGGARQGHRARRRRARRRGAPPRRLYGAERGVPDPRQPPRGPAAVHGGAEPRAGDEHRPHSTRGSPGR